MQVGHPVWRLQFLKGFLIVRGFHLIVEKSGIACAVSLIIQVIEYLVWPDKAITLSGGIFHIRFRQMVFQSWQDLVDALSDGVKGKFVDNLKI